ncbi:protein twisted gastrulation-like [Culicoides brevitarsis]|uniref:protein twisted gastrulation-like n=1 Tax=Culicoides brevitarsis TaxID=469753 RepID=UPI00307C3421
MREDKYFCWTTIGISAIVLLIIAVHNAQSCNEMVCGSQVSKCMLTQSCRCDLKNCSCCRECIQCLSYMYSECCSCVDLCPKPNETQNELSKQSYTDELEGIPEYFTTIAGGGTDITSEWQTFTFPVDYDASLYGDKLDTNIKYVMHSTDQDLDAKIKEREKIVTVNCTVVYMSQCISNNKCKESCQSMGASSYRWFHDGCCECVGSTCVNFGINESRCLSCPENKETFNTADWDDDVPLDQYDYGENMKIMDVNTAEK